MNQESLDFSECFENLFSMLDKNFEPENSVTLEAELSQNTASEMISAFEFSRDDFILQDLVQNIDVLLEFEFGESNLETDDSKISKTKLIVEQSVQSEEVTSLPESAKLSESIPRTPLTLADRDQLRAMIVLLNESNSVLQKIRQRFPLSTSIRCDVIQRQIQIQLQELFGQFRSNDVNRFRDMIPNNRQAFLSIWDHLAQLIVDSCYHP